MNSQVELNSSILEWSLRKKSLFTIALFYKITFPEEKAIFVSYNFIFFKMVPEKGLEPPRPKATDFESVVSTIPPLRLEVNDSLFLNRALVNYFCYH